MCWCGAAHVMLVLTWHVLLLQTWHHMLLLTWHASPFDYTCSQNKAACLQDLGLSQSH